MSLTVAYIAHSRLNSLALADARVTYDWAGLDPVLNRAANAMRAAVDERRRVAVFAPNAAENVIAYVAGVEAGVSTVPVSYHLTVSELVFILERLRCFGCAGWPGNCRCGFGSSETGRHHNDCGVALPIARGPDALGRLAGDSKCDMAPPSDAKPLPHLHYTSGTTGTPKATQTPPATWPPVETVASFVEAMQSRATPSPTLVCCPLYHNAPLVQARQMLAGVSLVVMDHFDAEHALRLIDKQKIAGATMVPTHLQRLLALPSEVRARYDVSSMQRMVHTGAACPAKVKLAMIDWFGPVLVDAYGGTEAGTTHVISASEWLERPGSVGKATPSFETLIIGDDDQPLGPGEEGRVYIRDKTGRGLIYEGDPEKTAASHIAPGVFTLGEIGYVDEEGYLFITDRASDMIVSGGVNIYPAEAEQVLLKHPKVADVAVIGAPNAEMGEEVKALVIPADKDAPPSAQELTAWCRASLAGFKCPRSYDFVEDIGRNAMGKVNKKALRATYWPTARTIGG